VCFIASFIAFSSLLSPLDKAWSQVFICIAVVILPSNRRRRRKGNPVPGVIIGPPCIFVFVFCFFAIALAAHSGPRLLIELRIHFFTDDRIPWTSNQAVARPLPKHRTTETQNKRIHTLNVHVVSGTRTHDPSVRTSDDSSCLRLLGYRDRLHPVPGCYKYGDLVLQVGGV
jgi:hypothetical protein